MATFSATSKHSSLRLSSGDEKLEAESCPTSTSTSTSKTKIVRKKKKVSSRLGARLSKTCVGKELVGPKTIVTLDLDGRIVNGKTILCLPVFEYKAMLARDTTTRSLHFQVENEGSHVCLNKKYENEESCHQSTSGAELAVGLCTRRVNVAKGLAAASSYDENGKVLSFSPQSSGNEACAWCFLSSASAGKTMVVGSDGTTEACRALRTGDVVTLEVTQEKFGDDPGEGRQVPVRTRIQLQLNFERAGPPIEFTTTSDLFAAVSLHATGQSVSLYRDDASAVLDNGGVAAPHLQEWRNDCDAELSLVRRAVEGTRRDLRAHFEEQRRELARREETAMAALAEAESRFVLPLEGQARALGILQRRQVSSPSSFSASCPPEPVHRHDRGAGAFLAAIAGGAPKIVARDRLDRLQVDASKLEKCEKELDKLTRKLQSTKEDLEKRKGQLKRSNVLVPSDLVHHVYASGWDRPQGAQEGFWQRYLQVGSLDSVKIHTRPELLCSWMEQGSPCCAAASVAGAFNALEASWGKGKEGADPSKCLAAPGKENLSPTLAEGGDPSPASSGRRLESSDVLEMYRRRWASHEQQHRSELAKLLQGDVEREEEEEGGEGWGGKLVSKIGFALEREYGIEFHPKLDGLSGFLERSFGEAVESKDLAGDNAAARAAREAFNKNRKEVEAKVRAWWAKRGGQSKLNAERPSTAPIGNETVLKIFDKIARDRGIPLRTWRFASTKKSQCQVSEADDEEVKKSQWRQVIAAIDNPSQVLLFHLQVRSRRCRRGAKNG